LFKSFRRKVIEKAKLKPQQSLDLDLHEHNAVTILNPESIFIDEQLDRRQKLLLSKALEQLSPVQKEVICLYFFEGFSYEKIAEIFEYSHTRSVRNLVYKAIEKMTDYINDSGLQLDSIILLVSFNYIFQV
jgi:RNA polymerase sigma-70 factor (ECF subfamily)